MRKKKERKVKNIVLATAIAAVLLIAAIGSASTGEQGGIGCVNSTGYAYQCGDTITESCTFTGNMSCTSGTGLIIGADGITIDGDGYRITGNVTGTDCELCGAEAPCVVSGIYDEGYDNVVIKNLEVEGFCTGIALKGTGPNKVRNITINNCEIHDNGLNTGVETGTQGIHACWIDAGDGGEPALTITNNEIYNNEGTGSGCGSGGNGIFIVAGAGDKHEYCNISHNELHDNAKAGFWTKAGLDQSEITYNKAWGNGNGAGITDTTRGGLILKCKASNRNLVAYNDVYDHDTYGYGIFVGGSNNTIEYNNVTNSSGHGISMYRSDGSYNNVLYENTVCDNGVDIYTCGSSCYGNIGDDNTCGTTSDYDDTGTAGCTYPCAPGVCGDVDGLPGVTTNDGRQIFMYLLYGEEQYPLADPWAADCDGLCDGITTNDGRQIFMNLLYGEEEYPLVCC